jgi:hypothetical protein
MQDVMASLTFQGKKGAFEVKDMSDADREWRLARETEDAESDRESRDGYEEMERFFLCGGR